MMLPPSVPDWLLAIVFGYGAGLSIYAVSKYKDYTYVAMIPSLLYMMLHYCTIRYVPLDIIHLWGSWGYFTLGMSILISKFWRLSYFLKGRTWKRL